MKKIKITAVATKWDGQPARDGWCNGMRGWCNGMGWEGWCNKITRWDGWTAVQRNGMPDGATIIDH